MTPPRPLQSNRSSTWDKVFCEYATPRGFCHVDIGLEKRALIDRDSGYNPPKFVTDAAKEALDRVECNQYSPTKVSLQPSPNLSIQQSPRPRTSFSEVQYRDDRD